MRGRRLPVIGRVAGAAVPRSDANIRLAVSESTHEALELRVFLDGTHADDFAGLVGEDAALEVVLRPRAGLGPGFTQVLHEEGIALAGAGVALLLDGHVAAGADDVGHVDEVVAAEAVEGDFGLFAFVAVVHGDDGARVLVVRGLDGGFAVGVDDEVFVAVEAVAEEFLGVPGFVGDEDFGHFGGFSFGFGLDLRAMRRRVGVVNSEFY